MSRRLVFEASVQEALGTLLRRALTAEGFGEVQRSDREAKSKKKPAEAARE